MSVQTPPSSKDWDSTEGFWQVQNMLEAEASHGEHSAPRQSQRHSEGLAVTTPADGYAELPRICARGFLGTCIRPSPEATTEPCRPQAARTSVPSESAPQPLDSVDRLTHEVRMLSPLGAVAISEHEPYIPCLACELHTRARSFLGTELGQVVQDGLGTPFCASGSATGFCIAHTGISVNRADRAVFNLWFHAAGRKNHSGHLLPLVISSVCLF